MKLIVGLGNPGSKYDKNRHNIGFMAVDRIADDHGFSSWKSKFSALISEGTVDGEKILLLKPQTFMNRSGQSVGEAMRFYKLSPADIHVIHDELDLAPGKARAKQGGGHAGHNGLRSIHSHIGADYGRVRLGIGHPGSKDQVARYVLNDFAKSDSEWLDDLMRGISDGIGQLAKGDSGKFMNAVALRTAPPRSSGGSKPKKPEAEAAPAPAANPTPAPAPEAAPEPQSALQRLVNKFR
jgi:PTH1 family peptidyl-tRNA hydrolase